MSKENLTHPAVDTHKLPDTPRSTPPEEKTYHVRFASPTVGPTKLPGFSYRYTVVGFSSVIYIATIHTRGGVQDATARVVECWPQAEIQKVAVGASNYDQNEIHPMTYAYGCEGERRRPGFFKRLFNLK